MKKFPEVVIGTLEKSPQGGHGNKDKIWVLQNDKYVCENPGLCKKELTLEEVASDLREGFLKEAPWITFAEHKLRQQYYEKL